MEGFIGYRDTLKCAVSLCDPVCPPENIEQLTNAFHEYCNEHNKTVIYLAASEKFMQLILEHKKNWTALEICQEIIIDPSQDPKARTGSHASLLRNKYNQAIRNGVVVKEYSGFDQELEEKLEQLSAAWLANRKGLQLHYAHNGIFTNRSNKRWFYAEQNGIILGFLVINRIDAHNGWVLNILRITPEAPKFTSEVILLSAFDILRKEGCQFFSTGPSPAPTVGEIKGVGATTEWLVRKSYQVAKKIFKLNDRQRFWKKFEPRLQPTFILFSRSRIGLSEVLGILNTYNTNMGKKKPKRIEPISS
jgi:lysylphosphatidylglycerol synthetase-like protein (DUF2156 family)